MLDIRKFNSHRKHGDLESYLTFQGETRYLVIKSAHRVASRPVAIPDKFAHLLAEPDGGPTDYLMQMASAYAVAMGYEVTDYFTPLEIIDIVLDRIPDLIELAPEMERPVEEGIEYKIKIDGTTVAEGVK